jgi:hypothetical protein
MRNWLLSVPASDTHQLELSAIASCSGGINYHLRMVHSGYLRLQIHMHLFGGLLLLIGDAVRKRSVNYNRFHDQGPVVLQ